MAEPTRIVAPIIGSLRLPSHPPPTRPVLPSTDDHPAPEPAGTSRHEAEAERQRRLGQESDSADPATLERRRRMTQEALADVDAGRLIDDAAMQAWADSLGSERELPPPQPR